MKTHLHDITKIVTWRIKGELANVRHLIFFRSMQFQIICLPHVTVICFIASCNMNVKIF